MYWKVEQKIFCVINYYDPKTFNVIQARYRRKFDFHAFPNRCQISKNFDAHYSSKVSRPTDSKPSGFPITLK